LPDGSRDILGIWIEQTEGAKFWLTCYGGRKIRKTPHTKFLTLPKPDSV
jgi:transposase-like protein